MAAPTEPKSAHDGFAITKSDTTVFGQHTDAIYVGGTGDVAVVTVRNNTLTYSAVPAGTILPVRCKQVLSTGTTATLLIGMLY